MNYKIMTLQEIEENVKSVANLIGAPEDLLPTF